jgi:hypothetical protein
MALNGFSTCNSAAIGTYRVPGTTRSLAVRREIAPLLIGMAKSFHEQVEPITKNPLDDWGYSCRRVRGRATVSFHAGGLAIDLNATRHPLGRRGTFNARQVATIRALCKKYGLRWGGDYNTARKDEMHFEVILPRAQALALVRRLQTPPAKAVAKAAPEAAPKPRLAKLKYGAKNSDVVLLQKALKRRGYDPGPTDGEYGPGTRMGVRAFQRAQGWTGKAADGLVGVQTLDRLF